jgi:hypothetical protein
MHSSHPRAQAVMFVLLAFGLYAEGKARAGHLFLWMAVVHMCQAAEVNDVMMT